MSVFCGAVGIMGSPFAGRLGDRFGRRTIGATVLCGFPLATAGFYLGPNWLVPVAWVVMVFLGMASAVVVRGLTNEVFPTGQRATASGLLTSVEALGGASSLFLYTYLMGVLDAGQAVVASSIALLALLAAGTLALFPETRQRELEAITGE